MQSLLYRYISDKAVVLRHYRYFYAKNGVLVMETKRQQEKSPQIKPVKERLSEKEIKELMGMNMPTYKRVHGAIRSK
jgi:hypothetical protein